ncbi:CDP-alcohol phosphatidyltransferase family protein [Gymnodinialimonas sp. 57CJ19]|uniref:CDP-alcohol phosphatidyltransferase family protein n=1 Tax=Gymnodinialimonas sp. 57CJ19 TaxID=3138498 RepID=UPI0031344699
MANLDKSSDVGLARFSVAAQFAVVGLIGGCFVAGVSWILLGNSPGILGGMCLYGVVIALALNGVRERFAHRTIGLCNGATIARLALVSVLVAVLMSGYALSWAVFGVAVVAFALDGVDGWLARREGRASAFGARFDMEVDSLLALVLALLVWQSGTVGAYVVILGLPRYAFWVAQFPFPSLNGALPERFSRKVVCVVQITALITALCPLVPAPVASVFVGAAAVALIWSFWVDVRHLSGARG